MSKRQIPQAPDFSSIVTDTAAPMTATAEPAATAPLRVVSNDAPPSRPPTATPVALMAGEAATANLENLNFKVPKSFRKRFRDCAYRADLKQNELLFAALDAWEAASKS